MTALSGALRRCERMKREQALGFGVFLIWLGGIILGISIGISIGQSLCK
jgi:hypothetical protein